MLEFGFQNLSWKLANEKRTIKTVANSPTDTNQPATIRTDVMNWSCGWRPPKAQVASADADGDESAGTGNSKPKSKKLSKAAAGKLVSKAAAAVPANTASTSPAAKTKVPLQQPAKAAN
jgi:hypothetical protein